MAPIPVVPDKDPLPRQGILLIVMLAFMWGLNWPAMRVAVAEISPWTFRAICLAVGTITLFGVSLARGRRLAIPRAEILPLIAVGLLNVTAFHLLTAHGLTQVEAGRGVILSFTFPLWSVLLGAVVLREALTPTRIIALLLGLGAMALLLGPEIAILGRAPWGSLMLIGSAICWAAATMWFRLVKWTLGTGELAAWQVAFGGVPVIVGAVIIDPLPDFSGISTDALVALFYSSTVPVSFGQWIWFRVLQLLPAAVAAISTLAVPVIGVFAGALLLGETVTIFELGALVLVSIALAIVLVGHAGWRRLVGKN